MDHAITQSETVIKGPCLKDAGFTLIELLVVVAVVSVLAVGASLAATRRGGAGPVATDMAWFQARFEAARNMAIGGRQTRGLRLRNRGLETALKDPTAWQATGTLRRWQGRAALVRQGRAPADITSPDIVFLPTGQTTAFQITFSAAGRKARRCNSDGWTGLTCDTP